MSDNRTPEALREGYLHIPTVERTLDSLCKQLNAEREIADDAIRFAVESGQSPTDWVISVLRSVQAAVEKGVLDV